MRSLLILTLFLFFNSTSVYPQWTEMSGPNKSPVLSVTSSGNNILAGTFQNGVFISTDYGESWQQTDLLKHDGVFDFTNSEAYTFAASGSSGAFVSTNHGINWTRSFPNNVLGICISSYEENAALGTNHSLFLSSNFGANWYSPTFLNEFVSDLILTQDYIFAAGRGVYYSTNNGANWLEGDLDNLFVNALDLIGGKLFAGTDTNGVFVSNDNGHTWQQTALKTQEVLTLIHFKNNLFAGTGVDGVYYSSNRGQSWKQINEGLPNLRINKLTILNNYLFAGTSGRNIWRRPLSEIIGITNTNSSIPDNFKLHQNFPNPFNPTTTINFELTKRAFVELTVINVSGKMCKTLVYDVLNAGSYSVNFNSEGLSSGVYYYRLGANVFGETNYFSTVRRMVLLK